jgi:hypothetical protein
MNDSFNFSKCEDTPIEQHDLWPDSMDLNNCSIVRLPPEPVELDVPFDDFMSIKYLDKTQVSNAYRPWRKNRTNPPTPFIVNDEHEVLWGLYKGEYRRLRRLNLAKAKAFRRKWIKILLSFVTDKFNLRKLCARNTLKNFVKWTESTNNIKDF